MSTRAAVSTGNGEFGNELAVEREALGCGEDPIVPVADPRPGTPPRPPVAAADPLQTFAVDSGNTDRGFTSPWVDWAFSKALEQIATETGRPAIIRQFDKALLPKP